MELWIGFLLALKWVMEFQAMGIELCYRLFVIISVWNVHICVNEFSQVEFISYYNCAVIITEIILTEDEFFLFYLFWIPRRLNGFGFKSRFKKCSETTPCACSAIENGPQRKGTNSRDRNGSDASASEIVSHIRDPGENENGYFRQTGEIRLISRPRVPIFLFCGRHFGRGLCLLFVDRRLE